MGIEAAILLLFVVASAVAVVARRFCIPYTVALVVAGLTLGALQLMKAPEMTRDMELVANCKMLLAMKLTCFSNCLNTIKFTGSCIDESNTSRST
jgi:Kef-type K+ transport system membrane component KefB